MDYENVWLTTSLRGVCNFTMKVSTVESGAHSGLSGGIVPDTFRIITELLRRIEDGVTGEVHEGLQVEIPPEAHEEAKYIAELCGNDYYKDYKFLPNTKPIS